MFSRIRGLLGSQEEQSGKAERVRNEQFRRSLPVYPIANHLADVERNQSEGTLKYWSPGHDGRSRTIGHQPPIELARSDPEEYERMRQAAPKFITLSLGSQSRSSWFGAWTSFETLDTCEYFRLSQWRHLTWLIQIHISQPVQGSIWAAIPRGDFIRIGKIALCDPLYPFHDWERKATASEFSSQDAEAVVQMRTLIRRADYEAPEKIVAA